ncbi:MAG: ASCH domain-containing protein [Devosiaceae bacterium]|nr:ASCH domain-containing protein [Devosiaceae bacterium]
MNMLHLNLKGEYFDQIEKGTKLLEFRLYSSEFWKKRLYKREYNGILIKRGYPKKDDRTRIIERPWRGYRVLIIEHKHFGHFPVKVFAIVVNSPNV